MGQTLKVDHCPQCGAELKDGFLGLRYWIRWYDEKIPFDKLRKKTWGKPLLRPPTDPGLPDAVNARRCEKCGLVVFISDPPGHGADEMRGYFQANRILLITALILYPLLIVGFILVLLIGC